MKKAVSQQQSKTAHRASRQLKALLTQLTTIPHCSSCPMPAPEGRDTGVTLYKIMNKMFAIVSQRGEPFVILKCDPQQVPLLKDQYQGVGHRSHLDPRFWICVQLDADVPTKTLIQLADHSYAQVVANLSKKQRSALTMKPVS